MNDLLYKEEVSKLVGFCMEIHRELGKGHDEVIYKDAFVVELQRGVLLQGRILAANAIDDRDHRGHGVVALCPLSYLVFLGVAIFLAARLARLAYESLEGSSDGA